MIYNRHLQLVKKFQKGSLINRKPDVSYGNRLAVLSGANNNGSATEVPLNEKYSAILNSRYKNKLEVQAEVDILNSEKERKDSDTASQLDLFDQAIYNYSDKRSIDYDKLSAALVDNAKWTALMESTLNNEARPNEEGNTSRGFFQFNNDSIETLKQRIQNVAKRNDSEIPKFAQDLIDGKKDIKDLTYDQQAKMYKLNMLEDKYSTVSDLMDKANYADQYIFHHRDPSVIQYFLDTKKFDLSLAEDKNILANLAGKANVDYMAKALIY